MPNLRKYWKDVSAIARGLTDAVWMTPHSGEPRLVEVPAVVAAKLLYSGTHRQATEAEIAAHRTAQEEVRQRAFRDDLRRKGIAIVPVSSEVNDK